VRHQSRVSIIDLHGQIDAFAHETLHGAYAEASTAEPVAILLNCSAVDYINSMGISLIVGLLMQARAAGRRLLTCGLSEHYREIFQITRLADFIRVFPDEASALADLSIAPSS
jgi:anti-anti-sigma factor